MKTQANSENKQKKYKNVTIIRFGLLTASILGGIAIGVLLTEIILFLSSVFELRGISWPTRSQFTVNISAIIFLLFFCFLGLVMTSRWCVTVTYKQCDWDSYRVYLERTLKRSRNSVRLHLSLLYTELVLGRYDECQAEIEEINRLEKRLSEEQKIVFKQHCIGYLYWTGDRDSSSEKLTEMSEMLQSAEKINENTRRALEENILLYKYLLEDNWEEVVSQEGKEKGGSVYVQVNRAYFMGKAYYQMGDYENAFSHLTFVAAWGGNTKYVSLAKEMLSTIPEKEKYEGITVEKPLNSKSGIYKKLRFFLACIVVFVGNCIFMLFGRNISADSVEEAYCKEYWIGGKDQVVVLYQKDFNDYEVAILCDGDKIGYCLCEKIEKESGETYKIINSIRTDQHIKTTMWEKATLQMFGESERESYQKSAKDNFVTMQMWTVMEELYMKNSSVYPDDFSYTGVSCYPDMEDYVIGGQQVEVEPVITINGTQFYIWHIEGIDLDSLDFLTFID